MSYTKSQVASLTKLAIAIHNDASLAQKFAEHMLEQFPSEALRFAASLIPSVLNKFKGVQAGCLWVTAEMQQWLHDNAAKYNKYINTYPGETNGYSQSYKIQAIKDARIQFGLGLKEAKDMVEGYPYKTY